jgi:hypothetical protein
MTDREINENKEKIIRGIAQISQLDKTAASKN